MRARCFPAASLSLLVAAIMFAASPAAARLAVAAIDGKQLVKGEETGVTPDSIAVIDLSGTPRVIGTVAAPGAMIGPPEAVAVARDESFAIVTASQKVNPADPYRPLPDDTVSMIDLKDPAHPRVLQTIKAGPGASGISLNRAGDLVLVACRNVDAVYAFTLKNRHLTPAGSVSLGKGADPTDVVFAPDGAHAYAITWGAGKVMELAVSGSRISLTGQDIATGRDAYGATVTADGNWLINTNVGGAATGEDRTGTLSMVNLRTHRLALSLPVGKTPEHVALSPDGRHIALVLANGTANVKSAPNYNGLLGILEVFAIGPGTITPVAKADSCHWAQGATWSQDGKLILQQCASEKQIMVYRFDGKSLIQDKAATISFQSRPGSIATSVSR